MEKNNFITKEEFDFLFSQIMFISGVNKKLFESLEKKVDVGQAFLTFGPYLLGYSTYVNKYNQIKQKIEGEKKINKFVQDLDDKRKSGSTNFDSHMILPIQRIPRYVLLLNGVLDCTSPDDQDYPKLKKALELIRKVMDAIESRNKESSQKDKVKEIANSVKNCKLTIIAPHRNYIFEDEIIHIEGKHITKGTLILFNDMIIMIDEKKSYLFEIMLNTLPECKIFKDPEEALKFGIISSQNKLFLFEASTTNSKNKWIDLIEIALEDQEFLEDKHIIEISQNLPSTFNITKKIGEIGTMDKTISSLEEIGKNQKEERDLETVEKSQGLTHSLSLIGQNINNQPVKRTRSRKSLDLTGIFSLDAGLVNGSFFKKKD